MSGFDSKNIDTLVIVPNLSDEEISSPLELEISNNDIILVPDAEDNYLVDKKVLYVKASSGKFSIPRNIVLNITTPSSVQGIIGCPACIQSESTIDLVLDHRNTLKVSFDSASYLFINNKMVYENDTYSNVVDYYNLEQEYYEKYVSGLNSPRVTSDAEGMRVDFERAKIDTIYMRDICSYVDLVFLSAEETISVYDKNLVLEKKKRFRLTKEQVMLKKIVFSLHEKNFLETEKLLKEFKKYVSKEDAREHKDTKIKLKLNK